jgi:galactarate dehydratase
VRTSGCCDAAGASLRRPADRQRQPDPPPPLDGYTFDGYLNPMALVGTRNILAITQTVQCVAGVTEFAVQRIKAQLLPKFPMWTTSWRWSTGYGWGVAIDARRHIPIRTCATSA